MFGVGSKYYVLIAGMDAHCAGPRVMSVNCAAGMTDCCAGPRVMCLDQAGEFNTPSLLLGLALLRV